MFSQLSTHKFIEQNIEAIVFHKKGCNNYALSTIEK